MIRAIIFDLDSCLCPADEPGQPLYQPAFDAITRANRESHSAAELQAAFAEMWRVPFDAVARKYHFTPAMFQAGWNEFLKVEVVGPMQGYGDLDALRSLPAELFLVTSGFRRLQESKIQALGIRPCFRAIYIDAIDEPQHPGKRPLFEEILRSRDLQPAEVLVVGDNPESELAVGRQLGMPTVQTLRPGVNPTDDVPNHIHSLKELKEVLGSHGAIG